MSKSRAGFSVGDVNGIGLEVFLKAFQHEMLFRQVTPVLFAHRAIVKAYAERLELKIPELRVIQQERDIQDEVINLVEPDAEIPELQLGASKKSAGSYAVASLNRAIEAIKAGMVPNLVTLPIDKSNVQSEEFSFPGHTEMLAKTFDCSDYMMILLGEDMRVGVVTGHIPVSEIAKHLNPALLEQKIRVLLNALRQDFGLIKPKLAVLGLNPHAGDQGLLGQEEELIIKPVIQRMREAGEVVMGPYSADGFFGEKRYQQFDAVLAMYHDQGLIPFKQQYFYTGINYTAGLPIIRTSPDHGTAFDIAGKNLASPSSLVHSIYAANEIYLKRLEYFELNKNTLGFIRHKSEKFSIGVPNMK